MWKVIILSAQCIAIFDRHTDVQLHPAIACHLDQFKIILHDVHLSSFCSCVRNMMFSMLTVFNQFHVQFSDDDT